MRRLFRRSPITWALIALNVAIFLFETLAGGSTKISVAILFGAQVSPLLSAGQYWRLFTAMFLHFGFLHLACNMISLYNLGPAIERFYGKARFLIIYLGAGVFGNLTTWAVEVRSGDYAVSAGASGAIFGLFGAHLAMGLLPWMRRFLSLRGIVVTLVLNVAYGLTYTNVNMAAHFGGLVGGAAIAALMILSLCRKGEKT